MVDAGPELAAALDYVAAGWPVLPCSPEHKRPLLAADKDADGKPIKSSGGLKKATLEPDVLRGWWRKWPKAMVAVATGHDRCFVLDFDPRVDSETGEVFELARLKADLEAQLGVALPLSVTAMTQSGGVHVWMRWPDDGGDPIRNRGNLPAHVDVRGAGGYVIMPPSVMASGRAYRWLSGRAPHEIAIADAPSALVEILRAGRGAAAPSPTPARAARQEGGMPAPARAQLTGDERVDAARRGYVLRAFDAEVAAVAATGQGERNQALFDGGLRLGQLVATGYLSRATAVGALEAVARGWPDFDKSAATIDNGITTGEGMPRDLSDVGARAGWADDKRGPTSATSRSATRGPEGPRGQGTARSAGNTAPTGGATPGPGTGGDSQTRSTLPDWRDGAADADRARVFAIGADWLARQAVPVGPDEAGALAYRVGMRFAAGMISPLAAWLMLAALGGGDDAGLVQGALAESFASGEARGFDVGPILLALRAAQYPMTDMGNAERFVARHGDDFRYTTAGGWMGWDTRRWAVLDQEQDATPAVVMAAVFSTVRAVQDEARAIEATGFKSDANPHGLNRAWFIGKKLVTLADELRKHGRSSEGSGRLGCIAALAKRWMTVEVTQFDADPFAINCNSGTLLLRREKVDGAWVAHSELVPHDRAMLISKLAPVDYDPDAPAPLYDGMMEWAQPKPAMRRYMAQWGGYCLSGHVGAQILQFWYGRGANGKSTVADAWAGVAGDYSGTVGIETFLDQGIKRRGDAATPDLARLGGVRFLRASEPERGAKLNEALVKAATGGEPMAVRALHRGFFDLRPVFKLTIGGNYKPDVPGTDEGIWRRLKLVPWDSFLEEGARDADLPHKLKAEYPGIFARLVAGLLDWMENGFSEPDEVIQATADYRSDSDPLARFISMCVVADPASRVQASKMHALFVAWCKAAGEREWTAKGLAQAMKNKGHSNKQSNGMQWLGLRMIKSVHDFVDADGRVLANLDALDGAEAASADGAPPPAGDAGGVPRDAVGPDAGDAGPPDQWDRWQDEDADYDPFA